MRKAILTFILCFTLIFVGTSCKKKNNSEKYQLNNIASENINNKIYDEYEIPNCEVGKTMAVTVCLKQNPVLQTTTLVTFINENSHSTFYFFNMNCYFDFEKIDNGYKIISGNQMCGIIAITYIN